MQVNSVTSQDNVTSTGSTGSTSNDSSPSPTGGLDSLANESTFLQLLVSQIKNQDPLNPTDSVQFLGQLTQLSQLEQLISIKQALTPTAAPSATDGSSKTTN